MKELTRRRIIRKKDIIIMDRGYYSYENYEISITLFKIVPIIFPRHNGNIKKIEARLSAPLDIYKSKKHINKNKKLYKSNIRLLLNKLNDWETLKPIRGIIEDFFKAAKGAYDLGVFHSYTYESMSNIYLCVLLTALTVQCRYNRKTRLQQLAEGIIDFSQPQKKAKKKIDKTKENNKTEETPYKNKTLDRYITVKEPQSTHENF